MGITARDAGISSFEGRGGGGPLSTSKRFNSCSSFSAFMVVSDDLRVTSSSVLCFGVDFFDVAVADTGVFTELFGIALLNSKASLEEAESSASAAAFSFAYSLYLFAR